MKIGITGHQNIGSDETIKWVTSVLSANIRDLSIDFGLTSLAIGADQLFAQLLKQNNIPYMVIIPCENYEKTFTDTTDLKSYHNLLSSSFDKFQLPFIKPSKTAFYNAGKEIVDRSDTIFAIWNGQPAKGLGGTGDIVKYAHSIKRSILHINPVTQIVNRI
jgi:hypothetical protein